MTDSLAVTPQVAAVSDRMVALRRKLHANPETSFNEFETSALVKRELDELGIPWKSVGETGVVGTVTGTLCSATPKCVALRADMDALGLEDLKNCDYRSRVSGVCHACGHDAHTAMLLGAARVLQSMRDSFCGEVRLCFQQAEESGGGGRIFASKGFLDGVDRTLAIHVCPLIPLGQLSATPGPFNASCDNFRITITGKGAHVSKPHLGIDALYVAAQTVVALQSIVARSVNPLETVVVGVGKLEAGTRFNVIAETAVMEGTFRTFSREMRSLAAEKIRRIAELTAETYGATARVEFEECCKVLVNDPTAGAEVANVAAKIVGPENVITDFPKSLGGDDFAEFLEKAPGCYVNLGTQSPDVAGSEVSLHNGHFDIDERALAIGASLFVEYCLDCFAA